MNKLPKIIELTQLFFKLGCISFGGPAAHIAMMQTEIVDKRKWIDQDEFLDMIGATNLIPGPNSTQMTMHIGHRRAGVLGVLAAGSAFIFPAFLITLAFSYCYVTYGQHPNFKPFIDGIKPAVLAIIFATLWKLAEKAIKTKTLAVIAAAVIIATLLSINEFIAILGGGFMGMLWIHFTAKDKIKNSSAMIITASTTAFASKKSIAAAVGMTTTAIAGASLFKLGLFFLKIAMVLYGSGYVLIAYIEGGLVHELEWLTQQQLLDSVAIGQLTPGPVLTTATVVGYIVLGLPGAIVATLAIFLPSFLLVSILSPVIPKVRKYPLASHFLDAINACSVGLMAAVTYNLTTSTLTHWPSWVIAIAAGIASLKFKVGPLWLVLGGAAAGYFLLPLAA